MPKIVYINEIIAISGRFTGRALLCITIGHIYGRNVSSGNQAPNFKHSDKIAGLADQHLV